MPLKVSVEVKKNKNMSNELLQALIDACYESTNEVMNSSVENSPVDTGNLRNSINSKVDENRIIGEVGTNVEYAVYQELGNGKTRAANGGKGFLRPALYDNYKKIVDIFNKRIGEILK